MEGTKAATTVSTLLILQVCDLGGNVLEQIHQILGCRPLNVNIAMEAKQTGLAHCLDCGFKNLMSFFGWRHWDVLDLDLHLLLELLQLLVFKQELTHFSFRSLKFLLSLDELSRSVLE